MAKTGTKRTKTKKEKRNIPTGIIHIQSTFNNTIVTVTDLEGNVVSQSSAGRVGFKGSRKSTPFAAQQATQAAVKAAVDLGLRSAEVRVNGAWRWERSGPEGLAGRGGEY